MRRLAAHALVFLVAALLALPALAQRKRTGPGLGPDNAPEVGDPAPDFELPLLSEDGTVTLSEAYQDQPVVLIFGSYTWPPFRNQAGRLEEIYQEYKDRARFYLVYIKEAHPSDGTSGKGLGSRRGPERQGRDGGSGRGVPGSADGVEVPQPKTFEERSGVASTCATALELTMPILVDGMDNAVNGAYSAAPDRLFVIGADGRIAYRGDQGPRGFDPDLMEEALAGIVKAAGEESGK